MKITSIVKMLVGVALLHCVAPAVFAEAAPVYDADSLQQPVESSQADVPPPPPETTFVPMQSTAQAPAPIASSPASMNNDQRIKRIEEQLNNLQNGEGAAHVDSLQEQVQTLRGQVEALTHQLEQLQTQQKAQYADMDKRLPAASKKTADDPNVGNPETLATATAKAPKSTVKPATAAVSTEDQPNVAEEQQIYQTAYNLIKAKKYTEAVDALQGMLKKYPSGQFASNAHYWLGELYGLLGKNDQALLEFSTVVNNYPDSPRVSDAQLKVGLIYSAQAKWTDAKSSFKKVINHYPGSASARLANEQLKQIKLAGH